MSWIQTYTGRAFDLFDPEPEQICIEDIAHALSNICRYTGHSKWHYSVAQHCVLMSERVAPEHALYALLHDAPEAYVNDLARPLKRSLVLEGYVEVEERVTKTVFKALGFSPTEEDLKAIAEADLRMLGTEWRQLFGPPPRKWPFDGEPYPMVLLKWSPEFAEASYLVRYRGLLL